jgi:hypothetical protein
LGIKAAFSFQTKNAAAMTVEQIENFLSNNPAQTNRPSKVFFKARSTFEGLFIQAPDYAELKKKNFWRLVAESRMEEYRRSKDINLSRIFNGSEFTRLTANT